jgi:hypothetical protein
VNVTVARCFGRGGSLAAAGGCGVDLLIVERLLMIRSGSSLPHLSH